MGVQTGDEFGAAFAKAANLPRAGSPAEWRLRVVAALVREGLPAAWLPTALEAAKGVAGGAARLMTPLVGNDALVVGKRVLALDVIWQAVVARVEGDEVDVKVQGWKEKKGLPRTKALVVATDGAGALLRLASGAGDAALVEALVEAGVNPLVADARANTPLHRAAAGGHVAICRALLAKGADKDEKNAQMQDAGDAARNAKQLPSSASSTRRSPIASLPTRCARARSGCAPRRPATSQRSHARTTRGRSRRSWSRAVASSSRRWRHSRRRTSTPPRSTRRARAARSTSPPRRDRADRAAASLAWRRDARVRWRHGAHAHVLGHEWCALALIKAGAVEAVDAKACADRSCQNWSRAVRSGTDQGGANVDAQRRDGLR